MFYSFDIGPVHFVSISTEFYYFLNFGINQVRAKTESGGGRVTVPGPRAVPVAGGGPGQG